MRYILVIICSLFVLLGMYIGKKKDLKYFSINSIFGLFLVNSLYNILTCYDLLYRNYHSTTWLYVILSIIVGFIIIKIISYKCDNVDDISITCFSILNCYLLCNNIFYSKFHLFLFIINIIYYILLGIYIKDSKSFINVFIGCILGIFISLISSWMLGYLFSSFIGIIIYFIYSTYNVVIRNKNKYAYFGLIISIICAVLGCIL